MGWSYVIAGYCAAGALLLLYVGRLRHRAKVLARALPKKSAGTRS